MKGIDNISWQDLASVAGGFNEKDLTAEEFNRLHRLREEFDKASRDKKEGKIGQEALDEVREKLNKFAEEMANKY